MDGESCFRSFRFANRRGVSGLRAERRRYADQLFIEPHDRFPLSPTAACPLGMHGLNRCFELKPTEPPVLERLSEVVFRLFN